MNEEEALKILGITSISEHEVYEQTKQQLNELYKNNFTMLSRPLEKGKTEELSKKIEACKLLTEDYQDQAKVFSDLVISAINDDKLDFLKLLLETVKNDDKFNYLNTEGTGGNIPLNFALGYTYKHELRVEAITLLLKHGADPNTKNREGKSLLHCVINNSNGVFCHKVTELLLDYKANPDAIDRQGKTLLHYLFEDKSHDCVEIAELLLKRGANPYIQNKCGESLLYKAYSEKRDDIVKLLLEHSASSDIKSERVQSLLCKACSEGRDNIVKLLLEHDANPDVKDQKGRSLFYYIVDSYRIDDRYKVVELFLDKGANPNMQDDLGRASLHYLCRKYYKDDGVEIAKLLLRRGADPDLKDKDGKKPIDLVSSYSDVGKLFGAIDYNKATSLGSVALLTTAGSIALISGVADAYIGKVWCSTLAAVMAAVALCCAYYTIKTLFFSPGPLPDLTEARAEFLNSQKLPDPAGGA
ncbi:ankyrin repeat domain-containing protein [Wolbachia endosymbiont (group A) of Agelastica alni]|uniref:ankyrin repeat domain-containing protein n=1 Tax=Wolbachia endosymbiont (group A) of Agelastica alni TaxID=3066130 RepID=UPI0031334142